MPGLLRSTDDPRVEAARISVRMCREIIADPTYPEHVRRRARRALRADLKLISEAA